MRFTTKEIIITDFFPDKCQKYFEIIIYYSLFILDIDEYSSISVYSASNEHHLEEGSRSLPPFSTY